MKRAAFLFALLLFAGVAVPMLLPWRYDLIYWNAIRAAPFTPGHPLGTDGVGRDLLARTLVGSSVTLGVAFTAALVSLVIGTAYGAIAGWLGGRVDEAMMRIVDGLYALPFMFVVILLMTMFGRSVLLVFLGIGAVEWLTMARIVRGQVITLKTRGFVEAARLAGAPSRAIVTGHLLPNLAGVVFAYLMLTVPQVVMVESFLSFLGLGVQEPLTSLGILVKEGADEMERAPIALLVPGVLLAAIIAGLTLVADRLRARIAG